MLGLIFAGGRSRRFGRDKATFQCPGLPASNIELAVQKLIPFCTQIVVCANEKNQETICRLLDKYNAVHVITDIPPFDHHGPLSALVAATTNFPQEQEFIAIAVDYPYLGMRTIRRLAAHPMTFLATDEHAHYSLAHFTSSRQQIISWLQQGNWRLRDFITCQCHCHPLNCASSFEFLNLNYQRGINNKMKNKDSMSTADFQKLISLVLNDLTIRRTMLENREQEVSQQMSSLERDAELEQLDDQIQQIQADFNHYQEFLDPKFDFNAQKYFQGPSMGLPNHP